MTPEVTLLTPVIEASDEKVSESEVVTPERKSSVCRLKRCIEGLAKSEALTLSLKTWLAVRVRVRVRVRVKVS